MKEVRKSTLALMALWLSACSKRDEAAIVLIDPVVTDILVERGDWIIVQHTSTDGRSEDVSYSFNRVAEDGSLRVFQCFSGGPDDGWHIQDFGAVATSPEELYPKAVERTWSGLTESEKVSIERIAAKLDYRLSH
jgi:hypothetical protein